MDTLNWTIFIVGIIIFILLVVFFITTELKSNIFTRLGFIDSKEDLYNITFQKFDFDYSLVSGIDNNENEENLISDAIKKTDTEDTPIIKEVDYYA